MCFVMRARGLWARRTTAIRFFFFLFQLNNRTARISKDKRAEITHLQYRVIRAVKTGYNLERNDGTRGVLI